MFNQLIIQRLRPCRAIYPNYPSIVKKRHSGYKVRTRIDLSKLSPTLYRWNGRVQTFCNLILICPFVTSPSFPAQPKNRPQKATVLFAAFSLSKTNLRERATSRTEWVIMPKLRRPSSPT